MRIMLFAVIVFGFSSAIAQEKKADYTVTAKDFGKEYQADPKGFTAKYKNKVVELTGEVFSTRPWKDDVMLEGNSKKGVSSQYVTCKPTSKLQEQLRGLAKGQEVTVRGNAGQGLGLYLTECEFVKLGASPAIPVTLASLDAEFTKDAGEAVKKYAGKSVVVRVKVLDAKTKDRRVFWTVTDVAGDGPKSVTQAESGFEDDYLKELQQVKAGDTIVLIGSVLAYPGHPDLWDVTVLKGPPEGVKLPDGKK